MPAWRYIPQQSPITPTGFTPHPPVLFTANNGTIPAVNVVKASLGRLEQLDHHGEACIVGDKRRTNIRIGWPGLHEWTFRNMAVRRYDPDATPLNYEDIVNTLCNHIRTFYEEMTHETASVSTDPSFDLRTFALDRLYVAGLCHVSPGSWQPILWYWIDDVPAAAA